MTVLGAAAIQVSRRAVLLPAQAMQPSSGLLNAASHGHTQICCVLLRTFDGRNKQISVRHGNPNQGASCKDVHKAVTDARCSCWCADAMHVSCDVVPALAATDNTPTNKKGRGSEGALSGVLS